MDVFVKNAPVQQTVRKVLIKVFHKQKEQRGGDEMRADRDQVDGYAKSFVDMLACGSTMLKIYYCDV